MKLIMQTVPTGTKCKLCTKIDTKTMRRSAEVDRINRWQRQPYKFAASIARATAMVRSLDGEIQELNAEWHRRVYGVEINTIDPRLQSSRLPNTPALPSAGMDAQEHAAVARFEFRQKREVYKGLPLTFETPSGPATVMAIPDSGSERNVISRDLAQHLGLKISRAGCQDRVLSCIDGGTICSTGNVEVFCRFSRTFHTEPRRIYCVFQVLESVISPVIMSAAFLERTETMTKYPKRLIERTLNAMQTPKVCALGRMRRRLHCSIDGQNAEALPDSGSDVDVMSLDYMLNRGLICEASDEQVIFADGRRKSVHGICVVQLSIGKDGRLVDNRPAVGMNTQRQEHSPRTSSPSSPSSLSSSSSSDAGLKFLEGGPVRHVIESRFYVLEGIDVDVLVGASSLESLKAFSHHQDAFFSPELESQFPALHRISLAERARKLARKLTVAEDSGRSDGKRIIGIPGFDFDAEAM